MAALKEDFQKETDFESNNNSTEIANLVICMSNLNSFMIETHIFHTFANLNHFV